MTNTPINKLTTNTRIVQVFRPAKHDAMIISRKLWVDRSHTEMNRTLISIFLGMCNRSTTNYKENNGIM